MAQRKLEELSAQECFDLLAGSRVGRLVYQDDLGPAAVPVNFALDGHDVVIRVEGGAKLAAMQQPRIAFEVDHIDEDERAGWSVLVRGHGQEVPLEHVPDMLREMGGRFPAPWAIGVHGTWLRITAETVTGRRLGEQRAALPI